MYYAVNSDFRTTTYFDCDFWRRVISVLTFTYLLDVLLHDILFNLYGIDFWKVIVAHL